MSDSDVRDTVRAFVTRNFYLADPAALGDETSFLSSGIVDSTGVLEVVTFIERTFGIPVLDEDITATLEAAGCYRRRDEAIRELLPEYGEGWRCKIVLPSVVDSDRLRIFELVASSPAGVESRVRVTPTTYLQIVAA